MNICRVGQNGNMLVSSRFFFSCKARFFAGLFFDVFFGFFFMSGTIAASLIEAFGIFAGYQNGSVVSDSGAVFVYAGPGASDRCGPAFQTASGGADPVWNGDLPETGSQRRNET